MVNGKLQRYASSGENFNYLGFEVIDPDSKVVEFDNFRNKAITSALRTQFAGRTASRRDDSLGRKTLSPISASRRDASLGADKRDRQIPLTSRMDDSFGRGIPTGCRDFLCRFLPKEASLRDAATPKSRTQSPILSHRYTGGREVLNNPNFNPHIYEGFKNESGGMKNLDFNVTEFSNIRRKVVVSNWMSTRFTLEFLGIWEQIYNPNFNSMGFHTVKNAM